MPRTPRPTAAEPTVIALHSSAAGSRQWAPYPALCPRHWLWHAPELLGYDDTPLPRRSPPHTLDIEATRLAHLLTQDTQAHLVGHSYGGAVALQMALRWPDRVRSITLYEPVRFGLLRHVAASEWEAILDFGTHVSALVMGGSREASAEAFVDYWSGRGSWRTLSDTRRERVLRHMPKVRMEFQALLTDPLEPKLLARLRMPVRVVRGAHSPGPARAVAAIVAANCPAGELVEFEQGHHMTPLLEPARFAATLLAHAPDPAPAPSGHRGRASVA